MVMNGNCLIVICEKYMYEEKCFLLPFGSMFYNHDSKNNINGDSVFVGS